MPSDHIHLPNDFSGEVRLFPLPNVVVFPHSLNPLRVFESRYREMFEDAIGDDRLIAMATLLPGHEADYYGRPPIAPTVCIGHIVKHQRNDDGTYDFVLVGLQRARIEHEITPVRSYRRAVVQLLQEPAVADDEGVKCLGRTLVAKAAALIPDFEQVLEPLEAGEISLATITDAVGHNVRLELPAKLRLLEENDPQVRAELLIAYLSDTGKVRRKLPPFSNN